MASFRKEEDDSEKQQNEFKRILNDLLKLPENRKCADCGSAAPRWASAYCGEYPTGIFICVLCSGIHRSLGTHITFVRSVSLDSWKPEAIKLMQSMGNARAAQLWEAKLSSDFKRPTSGAALEQFIKEKYQFRRYYLEQRGGPAPIRIHAVAPGAPSGAGGRGGGAGGPAPKFLPPHGRGGKGPQPAPAPRAPLQAPVQSTPSPPPQNTVPEPQAPLDINEADMGDSLFHELFQPQLSEPDPEISPFLPSQPIQPTQPIQPISTQPTQPIQPISTQPIQPTQPTQPIQPIQPISTQPIQPIQPMNQTNSVTTNILSLFDNPETIQTPIQSNPPQPTPNPAYPYPMYYPGYYPSYPYPYTTPIPHPTYHQ